MPEGRDSRRVLMPSDSPPAYFHRPAPATEANCEKCGVRKRTIAMRVVRVIGEIKHFCRACAAIKK